MTADRSQLSANGEDLVYVAVELHDADGALSYARKGSGRVRVRVSGAGTLAGFGNGNPIDVSSFQPGERTTFHGQVVAEPLARLSSGVECPLWVAVSYDQERVSVSRLA